MNGPDFLDEAGMTSHPLPTLRSRLFARVQASHAHESRFQTVRRDTGTWLAVARGVQCKPLARTGLADSCVLDMAPGAALPLNNAFTQIECVVLNGQASISGTVLPCGEAACAPHDAAHSIKAGDTGARLYLRLSAPNAPAATLVHFSTLSDSEGWDDFCAGVRIKALWQDGERSSMLVRMQAGASVNAHGHPLEEECMMLAGEAFIGDTLLRSSEYQLAPAGSRHGAVMSDVGALFYVHGSLDPAAYV